MNDPKCADLVDEVAERQIEYIRLLLCPEESDATETNDGRLALDDDLVADGWEELREMAYARFHEHGLSFDYCQPEGEEHYWCYLISCGGPQTEIRFYANHDLSLHRVEFWYLDWFDGAHVVVTGDPTVQALWELYSDTGTAEHVREQAIDD